MSNINRLKVNFDRATNALDALMDEVQEMQTELRVVTKERDELKATLDRAEVMAERRLKLRGP